MFLSAELPAKCYTKPAAFWPVSRSKSMKGEIIRRIYSILCARTGSHFTTGQEHIRDKIRSFFIRKGTECCILTGIYLAPRMKHL
jgi:hypothetical protein